MDIENMRVAYCVRHSTVQIKKEKHKKNTTSHHAILWKLQNPDMQKEGKQDTYTLAAYKHPIYKYGTFVYDYFHFST